MQELFHRSGVSMAMRLLGLAALGLWSLACCAPPPVVRAPTPTMLTDDGVPSSDIWKWSFPAIEPGAHDGRLVGYRVTEDVTLFTPNAELEFNVFHDAHGERINLGLARMVPVRELGMVLMRGSHILRLDLDARKLKRVYSFADGERLIGGHGAYLVTTRAMPGGHRFYLIAADGLKKQLDLRTDEHWPAIGTNIVHYGRVLMYGANLGRRHGRHYWRELAIFDLDGEELRDLPPAASDRLHWIEDRNLEDWIAKATPDDACHSVITADRPEQVISIGCDLDKPPTRR